MAHSGQKMWEDPDAKIKLRGSVNATNFNDHKRAEMVARKIMAEME